MSRYPTHWTCALAVVVSLLGGCAHHPNVAPVAQVTTRSVGPRPAQLQTTFDVIYTTPSRVDDGGILASTVSTKALQDGDVTDGQILHVELLWHPSAGETPLSQDATNLSIRYVLISGGEVGVYEGGGFGWPSGTLETGYAVVIDGATLQLSHATPGFVDLLSPAQISGTVAGPVDEIGARKLKWATQQFLAASLPPRQTASP